MPDAAADSGNQNWYGRTFTTARPGQPRAVRIVAGVLTVLGVLSIVRIVVTVAINLTQSGWDPGARTVFLVLNAITLGISALDLVLAHHLRRGRLWAWITTIVLLSMTVLLGGLVLIGELATGDAPLIGLAIVVPTLALLFALTVPRTARGFFTRQRYAGAPAAMPAQPGPWAPDR